MHVCFLARFSKLIFGLRSKIGRVNGLCTSHSIEPSLLYMCLLHISSFIIFTEKSLSTFSTFYIFHIQFTIVYHSIHAKSVLLHIHNRFSFISYVKQSSISTMHSVVRINSVAFAQMLLLIFRISYWNICTGFASVS